MSNRPSDAAAQPRRPMPSTPDARSTSTAPARGWPRRQAGRREPAEDRPVRRRLTRGRRRRWPPTSGCSPPPRRAYRVDRLGEHGIARRPSRRQRGASVPVGGQRQLRVAPGERRVTADGIRPPLVDVGHHDGPALHGRSHRTSSDRSCSRIRRSISCSCGDGSMPSPSTSAVRVRPKARNASPWRPHRYSASMCIARRFSRKGCSTVSASSSATTSRWRPARMSASIRASSARQPEPRSAA